MSPLLVSPLLVSRLLVGCAPRLPAITQVEPDLTAPFFSNPGLLEVGVTRIETDTTMVDRFLPPVGDVSTLLVGHAHYDHLMDVPYFLRRTLDPPGAGRGEGHSK